jgi:o-succinylbenzoate synthase
MRVLGAELHRLELPLVTPLRTSRTPAAPSRPVVLVRLVTDEGVGWGECAALAGPTYTAEHVDGAEDVLRRHLLPRLLGGRDLEPGAVGGRLDAVRGHPMAKAAVEMAVLDAGLRARGQRLRDHLGAVRDEVPAGVAIGISRDAGALVEQVEAWAAEGYRRVKLKIEPGWDRVPLAAVRAAVGEAVELVADANGAYDRTRIGALLALDDLGLAALEQPLPPDDLLGHAELAEQAQTPVALDESVASAHGAAVAAALGACRAISLKAPRVGGLAEAVRVRDVCVDAGLAAWCGGMLETGLGRAAALAVAGLAGVDQPGDLSASRRWFARDVTAPVELVDGHLRLPEGPGIGVDLDLDAVAAFTTRTVRVGA